jgi:molecular chaperone DnaK (HSP70)
MEMRLVDYFADEFRNQTGIDIRNNPKAMAKLKKQVKRTKQILSANTEAPLSVEALHEDADFRCSLTYCLFVTLELPFSSLLICSMNVRGNVEDWTFLLLKS